MFLRNDEQSDRIFFFFWFLLNSVRSWKTLFHLEDLFFFSYIFRVFINWTKIAKIICGRLNVRWQWCVEEKKEVEWPFYALQFPFSPFFLSQFPFFIYIVGYSQTYTRSAHRTIRPSNFMQSDFMYCIWVRIVHWRMLCNIKNHAGFNNHKVNWWLTMNIYYMHPKAATGARSDCIKSRMLEKWTSRKKKWKRLWLMDPRRFNPLFSPSKKKKKIIKINNSLLH